MPSDKSDSDPIESQWNETIAGEIRDRIQKDAASATVGGIDAVGPPDSSTSSSEQTVDVTTAVPSSSTPAAKETVDVNTGPSGAVGRNVEDLKRVDPLKRLQHDREIDDMEREILTATAGLDRGLSATSAQAQIVADLVTKLEAAGGGVTLSWVAAGKPHSSMDNFGGVWRLVYSSAFLKGNLGGSRPGPPAGLVPFSLGPIYQRIDTRGKLLDNIVQLLFPAPPLPLSPEAPSVRACLRHTFEVQGSRRVEIVYDSTFGEALTGEDVIQVMGQPLKFEPPALQRMLPKNLRSASFDVTFLDDQMRVTRGDREELRVYVKDSYAFGTDSYAFGTPELRDPDVANSFSDG